MINKLTHNEPMIDIPEVDEIEHINYLSDFREKVWPIYNKEGMTFGEALIVWRLNCLNNTMRDVRDAIEGESI